jgi:hypothetical protein
MATGFRKEARRSARKTEKVAVQIPEVRGADPRPADRRGLDGRDHEAEARRVGDVQNATRTKGGSTIRRKSNDYSDAQTP